jgi:phenylacetaldehyde dehydrogenase
MTTTITSNTVTRARAQLDFIAGSWIEPSGVLPTTLDDPNTGVPRQQQSATATEQVERALAAASALHTSEVWSASSVADRVALLDRVADGIESRSAEIAIEDSLANGNAITVSAQMASYLGPRVRSARNQLVEVGESSKLPADGRDVYLLRRPLGPAAVLAPWNAPTFVAVAKLASALAAGCPVILKPSEWAPGGCQIVSEIVASALDELALPAHAFQLVHGGAAVGSQLVGDSRIRAISFTGGGSGGRAVAVAAAPHFTALQLELGGHNPAIVLDDADVRLTASSLVEGMTKLNGQWCEAPGKVIVHESVHDDLVAAMLDELSRIRVGHCLDTRTEVGPLSHASHRAHLQARIDQLCSNGGKALTSSSLPDLGGWFFAPTLVVGLDADESQQELFGPAVSIHAVRSTEEALRAAAGPETGLAGFVFSRDVESALKTAARVPAGEIRINGCKLADLADGSEQSFWNNAGIGGHGPTDMVRFFQGRRTIGIDSAGLPI